MPLANTRARKSALALAALAAALIALAVVPAFASATILIESTGDEGGASRCEEPLVNGNCTLRSAIQAVDAHPNLGPVEFSPFVFQHRVGTDEIEPQTPLPPVTQSTEILAHEPAGGHGAPIVGIVAPAGSAGLTIEAPDVTVEGIAFVGGKAGVEVLGDAAGFKADDNWFGLRLDETAGAIAGPGIFVGPGDDAAEIGNGEESGRNVIGHAKVGIELEGVSLAKIQGNYIGVSPTGVGAIGVETGVRIVDGSSLESRFDEVGGTLGAAEIASHECVGPCNVIASDRGRGIDLAGSATEPAPAATGPTEIRGNFLGLGADGETLVGENAVGVDAAPSTPGCADGPGGAVVGGSGAGEANFIEGGGEAILAEGAESFSALGNVIGLAPDGSPSEPPENVAIGLCDTGLTQAAHVSGNKMKLGPDALGIETVDGNAQITLNTIEGSFSGILTRKTGADVGSTISGNTITEPDVYGIHLQDSGNVVTGNTIDKSGKYGILIEEEAERNRIGGDAAGEANTIDEAGVAPEGGAIVIEGEESSRNEIAANTGFGNVGAFIQLFGHSHEEIPNGLAPPTVATAKQSSATGTAVAGTTVRVFSKANAEAGELGTLLAVVKAGPTGAWEATFAKQAVGTLITATQTSEAGQPQAGTSALASPLAAVADPEEPNGGGGGGGGGGGDNGGGTNNGGGSSTNTPPSSTPTPVTTNATPKTAPKVTITKGPKKTSTSTTAKFTFKASVGGAKFECKLDNAKKWTSCKSPKTYKGLKPGKHTFQVRATASGVTGAVAKFQFKVAA